MRAPSGIRGREAEADAADGLLGIVVVNYGSAHLLQANLGAVDLTGQPVRVIVVDNYTSARERAAVEELVLERGWELVALPDNRGFGAGVNAGLAAARKAGCVCFLLLNPDAWLESEVLAELRRHVLADPTALVAPRLRTSGGRDFSVGSRLFLRSGRIRGAASASVPAGPSVEWLTGACLAVHDDLLRRSGDMDESYFLYWEDVEFSRRCVAAGGKLVQREDLQAVHDPGGTQGASGRGKSPLYYRWNCANRLRFAAQHLPRRTVLRWILVTPFVSWEILRRGGRRQLLRRPALLLAAVRGTVAGLVLAFAALVRRPAPRRPVKASVLVAHPGAELYGSDRMLAESVRGLVEQGHPVVVALPCSGPLVSELERRGARVVVCPMPVVRKSALAPRGLVALLRDSLRGVRPAWRLVREAGTAAVYVSTITVPLWLLIAAVQRRRVVLHVHEAEGSAPPLLRRLLAAPAVLADTVLVNSRFSHDVLLQSAPRLERRTVVVANGVAGPQQTIAPRSRIEGSARLLYIGRLAPRKGPQVAVECLAELVKRGIDARLDLLGSVFPGYEWFEERLRAQVQDAGLLSQVSFRGFVPDIWPVLREADVVLIPSVLDEPFGNTAVEAVLAARPTVVSATSGLVEAAAGYSSAQAVTPGDVLAWADAVERILDDWPHYSGSAMSDAETARRRHDPARYRAEVARWTIGGERP